MNLRIDLVMRMFDAHNWWENSFFSDFKQYRKLLTLLRRTHKVRLVARLFERGLCGNTTDD